MPMRANGKPQIAKKTFRLRNCVRFHKSDKRAPEETKRDEVSVAEAQTNAGGGTTRPTQVAGRDAVSLKGSLRLRQQRHDFYDIAVTGAIARRSAARAKSRVESSVGSAELESFTMSGISVQPRTTASQPLCFMRSMTR